MHFQEAIRNGLASCKNGILSSRANRYLLRKCKFLRTRVRLYSVPITLFVMRALAKDEANAA